jgi:hypothetical protein
MEHNYRTGDGDLVAYLCYQGFKLETVIPENQLRSVIFSLKVSPELIKEIDSYYNDLATVNPRTYSEQIKKMRILISTTKRNAVNEGV